ncbi:EamA family transporter [Vibrio sp. S4M6]|uniref:EamA family transporter n=1 Tax=Vibrio sinus TaxID=2946865 RepID=UPI002029EB32|nr:EamA family transporter [Vibrio sinus]MCL9780253.1 EamA family transporter [Vibrio sinus]
MNTFAMTLVIISAVFHAGWNILGKSSRGSGVAFTLSASATVSVILTPYIIWYLLEIGWHTLPESFWIMVLASGIFQIVYLVGLIVAYKHAEIGVIYPIVRALPVLMVGIVTSLLGSLLNATQWSGFVLITLGCVLVPLTSMRDLKWRSYCNLGVFWSFIAAIGTTGYSIVDKHALGLASKLTQQVMSDTYTAIFYLGVQFLAIALPILVWCLFTFKTNEIRQAWKIKKQAGVAGVMMAGTYGLVLIAMDMTANVSLVVALRQVSIVFGVIMGCVFLKESWSYARMAGVTMILVGLVLSLS